MLDCRRFGKMYRVSCNSGTVIANSKTTVCSLTNSTPLTYLVYVLYCVYMLVRVVPIRSTWCSLWVSSGCFSTENTTPYHRWLLRHCRKLLCCGTHWPYIKSQESVGNFTSYSTLAPNSLMAIRLGVQQRELATEAITFWTISGLKWHVPPFIISLAQMGPQWRWYFPNVPAIRY